MNIEVAFDCVFDRKLTYYCSYYQRSIIKVYWLVSIKLNCRIAQNQSDTKYIQAKFLNKMSSQCPLLHLLNDVIDWLEHPICSTRSKINLFIVLIMSIVSIYSKHPTGEPYKMILKIFSWIKALKRKDEEYFPKNKQARSTFILANFEHRMYHIYAQN